MKEIMYVGCFTDVNRAGAGDGGIGVFERNETNEWKLLQIVKQNNPAYLCFDEKKEHIYAIQAASDVIHSYKIEKDGKLTYLNSCESTKNNYCCVYDGQLFVSGRQESIYNLNADGSIKERCLCFTPFGEIGPLKNKQHSVSSHQFVFDKKYEYFVLPLHGSDRVDVYKYWKDRNNIELISTTPIQYASLPRHICFSNNNKFAYMLLEHCGGVMSFRYKDGILTPFQIQMSVPENYVGLRNTTGEIAIHPNGKLLALSNRGHDSILLMRIKENGSLEKIDWFTDGVSIPRFFTFDESGKFLYCANIGIQGESEDIYASELNAIPNTGSIVIFEVDEINEKLIKKDIIRYPAPSCILFKKITEN